MDSGRYINFKTTFIVFVFFIFFGISISGYAEDLKDPGIDSEIKSIWNEMVTRIVNKDIEGAIEYFTYSSRKRYREQFNMVAEKLPVIFSGMRYIEPVYIKDTEAKYRIRIKDANGERTVYIWFMKDFLGRWKIDKF